MSEEPVPYTVRSPTRSLSPDQWIRIARVVILALLQLAAVFGYDLLPRLGGVISAVSQDRGTWEKQK